MGGADAAAACRQFGIAARPGTRGGECFQAPFANPHARTLGTALA